MEHKDIYAAIAGVMSEIGYVQKERKQGLNYSFASEKAFISSLRPAMIEHGVVAHVSRLEPLREVYTASKGTSMNSTFVNGIVTFIHIASGTKIECAAMGEGSDVGDKSANKASTGLLKYALRQTFLIETGDDPDNHASGDMERGKKAEKPFDPTDLIREISFSASKSECSTQWVGASLQMLKYYNYTKPAVHAVEEKIRAKGLINELEKAGELTPEAARGEWVSLIAMKGREAAAKIIKLESRLK